MEALYASDSADDDKKKETALPEKKETTSEVPKKKRGRKPKSEKAKEEEANSGKASASESSAPTPGRSTSKRASAQNANLKLQETSDEDEFIRRIDKKKDRKESTSSRQSIEADKESSHQQNQVFSSAEPSLLVGGTISSHWRNQLFLSAELDFHWSKTFSFSYVNIHLSVTKIVNKIIFNKF